MYLSFCAHYLMGYESLSIIAPPTYNQNPIFLFVTLSWVQILCMLG